MNASATAGPSPNRRFIAARRSIQSGATDTTRSSCFGAFPFITVWTKESSNETSSILACWDVEDLWYDSVC